MGLGLQRCFRHFWGPFLSEPRPQAAVDSLSCLQIRDNRGTVKYLEVPISTAPRVKHMKDKPSGRLQLGDPLAGDLADFCAAHYGAAEREIIRAALRAFIDSKLDAEPEVRKRYDAAKKLRLGGEPPKIVKLHPGGE
jgi:hypothetical protein